MQYVETFEMNVCTVRARDRKFRVAPLLYGTIMTPESVWVPGRMVKFVFVSTCRDGIQKKKILSLHSGGYQGDS